MRQNRRILFWVGVLSAALGTACASYRPAPQQPLPAEKIPAGTQEVRVVRVVDGDTIVVAPDRPGGPVPAGEHRVRLLEIDAPETVRPNAPVECGGAGASAFAKAELPPGSAVYLLADREDKDEFGRYLRYVWDFEGEFFNEKTVAEGHARAVLYRPNDLYIGRIRAAEAAARRNSKGIWGDVCAAAQ